MVEDLAYSIERLLAFGRGDAARLNRILEDLRKKQSLSSSDEDYLKELISTISPEKKEVDLENEKSLSVLKNRLAKGEITIEDFNSLKNTILEKDSIKQTKKPKSKKTVLIFSLIGILGLFGIGHIYLGKKARGIGIMITGFIAWFNTGMSFYLSPLAGTVGIIIVFLLFVWQIFDARNIYEIIHEKKIASQFRIALFRTGTLFCILAGIIGVLFFSSFMLNMDNLDTLRYELVKSNIITNPLTDSVQQTESWKNCVKQYGISQCGNPPQNPFSSEPVDCNTNPNAYECNPFRWP